MNEYKINAFVARQATDKAHLPIAEYKKVETEEILNKILELANLGFHILRLSHIDSIVVERLQTLGFYVTMYADRSVSNSNGINVKQNYVVTW